MILFEFDECYRQQEFYKDENVEKIDFTSLEGVNGYCDDEAKAYILEEMQKHNDSISFWGNGNYHYMSYLALHKITQDFSLLVFDHHPDMQPSFFEELLSCGCWIKHALEHLEHLKNVTVIGVKKELLEELAQTDGFVFIGESDGIYRYEKNKKPIICVEEYVGEKSLEPIFREMLLYPVYVSIDKDVLSEKDCVTNWDAGSMRLETMMKLLEDIGTTYPILAVDVCGELENILETTLKNNECNKQILKWWLNLQK